jgi:hypothetical protein
VRQPRRCLLRIPCTVGGGSCRFRHARDVLLGDFTCAARCFGHVARHFIGRRVLIFRRRERAWTDVRRPLRSWISGSNGRVRVRKMRRPHGGKAERSCYAALCLRDDRFDSMTAILIRLLASTAAPTNSSKRWRPSARQRFMPRPRNRQPCIATRYRSDATKY